MFGFFSACFATVFARVILMKIFFAASEGGYKNGSSRCCLVNLKSVVKKKAEFSLPFSEIIIIGWRLLLCNGNAGQNVQTPLFPVLPNVRDVRWKSVSGHVPATFYHTS